MIIFSDEQNRDKKKDTFKNGQVSLTIDDFYHIRFIKKKKKASHVL